METKKRLENKTRKKKGNGKKKRFENVYQNASSRLQVKINLSIYIFSLSDIFFFSYLTYQKNYLVEKKSITF